MRPDALASMQDICQILGIDAEPFGGFFDRQPLANDEADGRPVQGGFGPGVVLALHIRYAPHPLRSAQDSILRAAWSKRNRHLYAARYRFRAVNAYSGRG
jgi:hypothetical protein